VIEVKNLSLSFDNQPILRDISFQLENGQNLVIIGRSGSGKTVLIKTMMGIFQPDFGWVRVDGSEVVCGGTRTNTDVCHSFAMVFQNSALLDSYTVFQNVALPLYERGEMDFETIQKKVSESLAVVGLEGIENKFPADLSGGMRKRVGIARALVYEPRYIIFDEPTSGLDPITAAEVLFYITQIINSGKATTITITHDTRDLQNIGDQMLFLEKGELRYFGPLNQVHQSQDPLMRQFLNMGTNDTFFEIQK
jgi:phospholipid/cholesterol/gamma-HCH transport system ATP-binding protein